jgi:serine/threonine protein kinase
VLDFGIAKVSGAEEPGDPRGTGRALTRVGTVMGTAGYMAPEQALGTAVDARADLYSFGVVVYEALANKRPFDAEEVAQILAKQLTETPAALPEHVPADLAALIVKLLARSPDARVQSAAALVQELERIGASVPARTELVTARTEVMLAQEVPVSTAGAAISGGTFATKMRGLSRATLVMVGLGAAIVLAFITAFSERRASDAANAAMSSAVAASASVSAMVPSAASASPSAVGSAAPKASAATPPASVSETSEIRTSRTNGRTTTTRTTRRTTVEQHTTRRQRSHGGLYIPPPSQWFK